MDPFHPFQKEAPMTTETIRFSKWQRCNLAAAALAFVVLLFFFIGLMLDLSNPHNISGPFFLINISLALLFLAAIFVTGVRAINAVLFRIEFLEFSFRVHSFSWKGKKVQEHPYVDVASVRRGLKRGEVIVGFNRSMPLQLTPFAYEGKEKRLLAEFEKRLPPGMMEPGLGIAISRFKKYDKITYPLLIAAQAGLLLLVGQMVGMGLARPYHGWRNVIPYQVGTFYKGLSVDDRGAVWFVTTNVDTDDVKIGRLSGGETRRWDVPADAFSGDDNAYDILGVTGNSKGYPVAILETYMISWTGTEWKRTSISQDFYWTRGLTFSDDALYFFDYADGKYQYWYCPLGVDGCESLPIPEALSDSGIRPISYGGSAAGPVLAAGASIGPITFYRYEDRKWNAITGPLDFPESFLLAWTVSGDGTPWVTKLQNPDTVWQGYSPGPLAIGHWDAAAGEWFWSTTEAFPGSFRLDVDRMTVDPQGRIWITGSYETADVNIGRTAAAYVIRGERAELVVCYTNKNSNLQDSGIVQGPDGKIWNAESSLVSLDASEEALPAPIPARIADLDNNKFQWVLLGAVLVLEAAYFIVQAIINREQKKIDDLEKKAEAGNPGSDLGG
jgi:hypothetical protein